MVSSGKRNSVQQGYQGIGTYLLSPENTPSPNLRQTDSTDSSLEGEPPVRTCLVSPMGGQLASCLWWARKLCLYCSHSPSYLVSIRP